MVRGESQLPDDALPALRSALESLQGTKSSMPHSAMIELAGLDLGGGLTIDFTARETLGHPLVVLRPEHACPLAGLLSPRELEVAQGIAQGLANKEIALRMRISLATVKDHVHRILTKTGLSNRAAIAAKLSDSR